jgi:GntR family transcriptional regulator, transcriptional repressor for pyruvate dehydrogenase complex
MTRSLKPIEIPTLSDEVVYQIESLILTGTVKPGQKLAPERELAAQLGVSRPVVHSAIMQLEQKGLVRLEPRHGCFVNDYRTEGSAELLTSLWRHKGEELEPAIVESMLEFRVAVEQEAAARAAERVAGGDEVLHAELHQLLDEAERCDRALPQLLAKHDYQFHFTIALRSGNLVYPMLMNTFKSIYLTLLERFFSDPEVVDRVHRLRRELLGFIGRGDAPGARRLMRRLSEIGSYE